MKKLIIFGLFLSFASIACSEHSDTVSYVLNNKWIKKRSIFSDSSVFRRNDSTIIFISTRIIETRIAEVPDSTHHLNEMNIDKLAKTGRMRDWETFGHFSHPWLSIFSARKRVNEFVIKNKKVSIVPIDEGIDWWMILSCPSFVFATFLIFSSGTYNKHKFIFVFVGSFVCFAVSTAFFGYQINNQNDGTDYLKALVLPAVILFIATALKWLNEKLVDLQHPSI